MLTSRTSPVAPLAVAGALVALACTPPAPSGAATPSPAPAPETIAFDAATAGDGQGTRTTTGTFAMTGPVADAGVLRTTYRFAGPRIRATAVLIGAGGVLTISLRGASGPTVAGHEREAGRWHVCGGSDEYRHLRGHGSWTADADFGTGPAGELLPTIRGALTGRLRTSAA